MRWDQGRRDGVHQLHRDVVAGDDQRRTLREVAMSSQTSSAKLGTGSSSELYVHVFDRDVAGVGLFSERTTSVCPGLIWPGAIAD